MVLSPGFQPGGADLAVDISVLEGLEEAEGLIDGTANGEIVDGDLAESALAVNDEKTTEGDAFLLDEDAVVTRDLLGDVSNDGDLHVAKTALLARGVHPSEMAEVRINGASQNLDADGLELLNTLGESDDLSGQTKVKSKG
eukprot:TRINITY_DN742_c0_g1_i10.p1 TRINITY_DN742_c0_g1~~TRINITY_DN742_c0_g1_i10.p1  ORF type:complete len:141 (+),score=52.72 TRINITY_DN742_c0_g1_i10:69-491(+)